MKYGESEAEMKSRIGKWHITFAWWPKTISIGINKGRKLWLEYYEYKWFSEVQHWYSVREVK